MNEEKNRKEIIEIFEKLEQQAKEIYPNINEDIATFNSMKVEQENYLEFISLLNEHPLPKVSNQTSLD